MREIRTSSSMRGGRKRAFARRACLLLYGVPKRNILSSLTIRFVRWRQILLDANARAVRYRNFVKFPLTRCTCCPAACKSMKTR